METSNKLLITMGDDPIMEMIYMGSTQTQYLFSKPENIVHFPEKAILWATHDMGTIEFIPIKKKHDFIQLDESTWKLDVEPIDKEDL